MPQFKTPSPSNTCWVDIGSPKIFIWAAILALLSGCGSSDIQTKLDSEKTTSTETNVVKSQATLDQPVESNTTLTAQASIEPIISGKQVYDQACFACHSTGVSGAPIYGDAKAWAPRIEQDLEILYDRSINGYSGQLGYMPPKGGFVKLSIEEVLAAVDYMVQGI